MDIQPWVTSLTGLGGLVLGGYTVRVTTRHSAEEAAKARLWDKRSEIYAELLTTLRRKDIQEWTAPGSTSWEKLLTSDLYGRVMALGSSGVGSAFLTCATSTDEATRKESLAQLDHAVIQELQGH